MRAAWRAPGTRPCGDSTRTTSHAIPRRARPTARAPARWRAGRSGGRAGGAARPRGPTCRAGTRGCDRGRAPPPWPCRRSNVSPPTTIAAAPTIADPNATSAGVRLSPSAYDARAKKQERAVGEQADAERRERRGEEVESPAVADLDHLASPAARARRTPRSPAAASATCRRAPHRTRSANAAMSPCAGVDGELGEDRRVDRLGQDRVRREERDEAELVRDHSPGDLVAHHQRGAEQHRDVGLQRRPTPRATATGAACGRPCRAWPAGGTRCAGARPSGTPDEAEHAERAADREHSFSRGGEVEAGRRSRA